MNYPADWPRCRCGEPVLDGHLTCGRVECGTQADAAAAILLRCGECLMDDVEIVTLVHGICPRCGADYRDIVARLP